MKKLFSLLLLSSIFYPCILLADDIAFQKNKDDSFQPRVEGGLKIGNKRNIANTEIWAPITQSIDDVMYLDIRYMGDNSDNNEGNIGIGYRKLSKNTIFGGHAWVDRRTTDLGSSFNQVTLGFELMQKDWDLKLNSYIPTSDAKTCGSGTTTASSPYLSGTGLFIDTAGSIIEEPLNGIDLETGFRIPVFENTIDSIRLYGGGYAFNGDKSDSIQGTRTRINAEINPWVNLGFRLQHDKERGTQSIAEVSLRLPVQAKKSFRKDGLRARMDESPERDIDIVSNKAVTAATRQSVLNNDSNAAQRILYVDNSATAGGDGSKEKPFNSLTAAAAIMQDNDIIYIDHGNGTTSGQNTGITINKDNVQLIGSGTDFVFDTNKFSAPSSAFFNGHVLIPASTAPVITNNASSGNFYRAAVLVKGDDAVISGIDVNGGENGVTVAAVTSSEKINNVTIKNVNVSNIANRGIYALAIDGGEIGNVNIQNNIIQNTSLYGLVTNVWGGGKITNLNLEGNNVNNTINYYGSVISIADNTSSISSINFKDNIISNSGRVGLYMDYNNNAELGNLNISNNTFDNNGSRAHIELNSYTATIDSINIANNEIANNGDGMDIYIGDTAVNSITIDNNNIHNGSGDGIYIDPYDGGVINNVIINNNDIKNKTGIYAWGIWLDSYTTGSNITAVITNNNTSNNAQGGIYINGQSGSASTVKLENNIAANNALNGIYIVDNTSGTFTVDMGGGTLSSQGNNSFYNNTGTDVRISGTSIKAEDNWWGSTSGLAGGEQTLENGGTIDATPYLTLDPNL